MRILHQPTRKPRVCLQKAFCAQVCFWIVTLIFKATGCVRHRKCVFSGEEMHRRVEERDVQVVVTGDESGGGGGGGEEGNIVDGLGMKMRR